MRCELYSRRSALLLLGILLLGCGDGNGAPALAVGESAGAAEAPSRVAAEGSAAPAGARSDAAFSGDDRELIVRAAQEYVREQTAVGSATVEIDAVVEGWARVRVIPAGDVTDPATMYLRREDDGDWMVIVLGTGFAPEDYVELGIPEAVRPPS